MSVNISPTLQTEPQKTEVQIEPVKPETSESRLDNLEKALKLNERLAALEQKITDQTTPFWKLAWWGRRWCQ